MKAILVLALAALPAMAQDARQLLSQYTAEARREAPAFSPSGARGATFFATTHGGEWSCSTCHGASGTDPGKHATTGKVIAPLAPGAASSRFTDAARSEKWFRRNCNDVMSRPCTAQEKADVLAFLIARAGR